MRRLFIPAALVAMLLMLQSSPASAACGWTVVPTPSKGTTFDNFAMDADYTSKDDGWLVGHYQGDAGNILFTMHWDGERWKFVKIATPGDSAALYSVAALEDGSAWTVGYNSAGPIRFFFNGRKWARVRGPADELETASLMGVEAISRRNVWAVGAAGSSSLVERWNGKRWKVVSHPSMGGTGSWLKNISRVPGTRDLWMVGGYTDGPYHPGVLYRHAGAWEAPAVPDPGSGSAEDIAASGPDDAWIVGYRNLGGANPTWTSHWNGSSWTTMPSPSPSGISPGNALYGVAAVSPDKVYAAGYMYVPSSGNDPLAFRWNGVDWLDVSPVSGDETFEFREAAEIPGTKKVSLIGFERVDGRFETRVVTGC